MQFAKFFTVTAIIFSLVSLSFGQISTGGGGYSNGEITFKKEVFEQNLTNALAPNVMGYQYVLIKDGKIVSDKFGGNARNATDGVMKMTATTPQNIGSLQKFITGTTLLNQMVYPTFYTVDKEMSLEQKLDRNFFTLFPNLWYKTLNPSVTGITIRQLLQHRSGFDMQKPNNRTVLGYLRDANGFDATMFNQREYANINFVLNGYLVGLYDNPDIANSMNANISWNDMTDAGANQYVLNTMGNSMHAAMKQRIWDKMTPKILPSCDAKNALANTAAYGYLSRNDTNTGIISSQIENKGHCSGEGGYYMSARDFANYVAHFSASNLIVNKEARDLMFNDNMTNVDDRLVWALATQDNWMKNNFNMEYVAWSNGVPGGNRSVLLRLPQNYYLVIVTNTPDITAAGLYNVGVAAFKEGMKHNF